MTFISIMAKMRGRLIGAITPSRKNIMDEKIQPMPVPLRKKSKRMIKMGAICYAQMIKLLSEGTYNCREIAGLTGLHYVTVLQYTRELYLADAVHIHMWDKDAQGRDCIKIYKFGQGKDAKRLRMTSKERSSQARSKAKQLQLIQRMAA